MSQPKKGRPGATVLGVVLQLLPALLLCGLFAAVGIVHVGARVMVVRTGYKLSELQRRTQELQAEQAQLRLELATLKAPSRLERIAREELGMFPPAPASVLTVGTQRHARAVAGARPLEVVERSAR